MNVEIVVAITPSGGFAFQGDTPWHLPGDLKHFKTITSTTKDPKKRNAVLMGRKTWFSLPSRHRPLPDRLNVVLSRKFKIDYTEGVEWCRSMQGALDLVQKQTNIENIFIIGGASLFQEVMAMDSCRRLHVTHLQQEFQCDTFFPPIDPVVFKPIRTNLETGEMQHEAGIDYCFVCYEKQQKLKILFSTFAKNINRFIRS